MVHCDVNCILLFLLTLVQRCDLVTCHHDTCQRQQFVEHPGYGYTGSYLVYAGPWPYNLCERLCRQYLECTTFVMEWTEGDYGFGRCGLIDQSPNRELLVASDHVSIYGKRLPRYNLHSYKKRHLLFQYFTL